MHFGENQLSPRSFGISPLPTAHPSILNHRWVRASSPHYRTFTLAMGSSRGFGSARCHCTPSSDSLSLRLRATTPLTYRDTEQLAGSFFNRHAVTPRRVLRLLVGARFQDLCIPLPGCFSPFPHGTLRYRSSRVFSLGGWSPRLPAGFLVPRGTQVPNQRRRPASAYGTLTRSGRPSQTVRLAAGLLHRRDPCGDPHWVLQPPASNARRLGTDGV
jgi:hypothetical protein